MPSSYRRYGIALGSDVLQWLCLQREPDWPRLSDINSKEIMIQVDTGTTSGFDYLLGLFSTTTVTSIFNLIVGTIGIAGYLGTESVA